ncbi:hypothetical protein DFR27_1606 [Umboniibacter marinipuniceus]|uniref:Uncharacterized protein n=1 Tax=Umboniibacter marinipuniceus TaxID=569599 RepID=A0A3M0AMM9_9GAMM|nr:hypothetical protein DFR27_1606 [Umboniibacter marinipuniceus]
MQAVVLIVSNSVSAVVLTSKTPYAEEKSALGALFFALKMTGRSHFIGYHY